MNEQASKQDLIDLEVKIIDRMEALDFDQQTRLGFVKDLIENGRSQNSAEHSTFEYGQRVLRDGVNKMLAQWDKMWRGPTEPHKDPPGKP